MARSEFATALQDVLAAQRAYDECVAACREDASYFCSRESRLLDDAVQRFDELFDARVLELMDKHVHESSRKGGAA